jgi:hypothetical protein
MLIPSKHTEINHTLLAVSASLLRHMRLKKVEHYTDLRELIRARSFADDVLFVPALSFLFVLGLIEYRPKADLIEYTGPR